MIRSLCALLLVSGLCTSGLAAASEALFVDVRTASEFNAGHVDGALHIPWDEIADRADELGSDKDAPLYLYCRSGNRSGKAKAILDQLGYTQVINAGGLEEALDKAAELDQQAGQ